MLDDPAWFLADLDLRRQSAVLTRATRQSLSEAPFLDHRWDRGDAPSTSVPVDALRAFAGRAQPAMIWHTAFCCSTLIADLLDAPGACLALKEPVALVELGAARLAGAPIADDRLVGAVFARLGQSPDPGERVVIKPSNGANALVGFDTGAPALMLYSSCRDFILSVIAGGEERRRFVRGLMMDRATVARPTTPWRPADLGLMTDLQVTAVLWHAQVAEFRTVARRRGPAHVRSLDCARFLADPHTCLTAIDDFLGLGLGGARVDAAVRSEKLARYAKSPAQAFSPAQRDRDLRAAAEALGPALDAVLAWSHQVCPATPPGDPVGSPLLALA